MKANPAISVLMPCYNAADTLEEALNSLACQTLSDFEVVVVDDGSEDDTPEVLARWTRSDTRFRFLSTPHLGIVSALNAGIRLCHAPLIARMDADDRCHPQRLELQATYLQARPEAALVACRVKGFPSEQVRQGLDTYLEWQNSLLDDEDIRREIFVESPLAHPSVMLRREWLERAGGYQDHGWAEDYDLWLRLYLSGARFAKLPDVLLEWREHPDRLTRMDGRYSLENFLRLKAYYLALGPCAGRDAVILWGAGMTGRRLSKHLLRKGVPLVAFVDIDPRKIGKTCRGLPILCYQELAGWWKRYSNPVILAAVGARGARSLIRQRLSALGYSEGQDWWCVA
jgi:glycosyltransferase involved in cell wall biosynthesis